jgi:MerR family mercuric resistance operon transcriptional regulator
MRRYTEADAERLRFIKRAQAMGFSLTEIESLLSLRARRSCRATRALAASKLATVDARIRELRGLRKELAGLIASCDANAEDGSCPVIERLAS